MSPENLSKRVTMVLSYHKIGRPTDGQYPTWNYVPEATFAEQLRRLDKDGWTVIDIQTFLKGLADSDILPFRSALLTFDDAYRSVLTTALPILLEFGYPAVVFVPTDFVGRLNTFDEGIEPSERICSWRELEALAEQGVSVQSHGTAHSRFGQLDAGQKEKELSRSRRILEERLKSRIEVFAYPYGDPGTIFAETRKLLIQAGYKAAFLYGGGVQALPVEDPYLLNRVAVGPDTALAELAVKRGTTTD